MYSSYYVEIHFDLKLNTTISFSALQIQKVSKLSPVQLLVLVYQQTDENWSGQGNAPETI